MHILIKSDDYMIVCCWILYMFCDAHSMMFLSGILQTAINSPLHENVLFVFIVNQE